MKLTPGWNTEQNSLFKSKMKFEPNGNLMRTPKNSLQKEKKIYLRKKEISGKLISKFIAKNMYKMFHKTIFTQINSQKVK